MFFHASSNRVSCTFFSTELVLKTFVHGSMHFRVYLLAIFALILHNHGLLLYFSYQPPYFKAKARESGARIALNALYFHPHTCNLSASKPIRTNLNNAFSNF
ncbi:hypothetical protein S245_037528 [Arachis hypogaea]